MQAHTGPTEASPGLGDSRHGRPLASYARYSDAERVVDYLADHDFPVERVAIVGHNLRFVEQVTGRMTLIDATLRGAAVGGLTGLLIGWLFAVFNWFDPLVPWGWLVFDALWVGLVVGAVAALVGHALTRGRRDFASVPAMQAERYEVVADDEVADRAEQLIREMSGHEHGRTP